MNLYYIKCSRFTNNNNNMETKHEIDERTNLHSFYIDEEDWRIKN